MKFSGVITIDKSDVHAKSQGQRSKADIVKSFGSLPDWRTSKLFENLDSTGPPKVQDLIIFSIIFP